MRTFSLERNHSSTVSVEETFDLPTLMSPIFKVPEIPNSSLKKPLAIYPKFGQMLDHSRKIPLKRLSVLSHRVQIIWKAVHQP